MAFENGNIYRGVVAITGVMGSGKSTVAAMLARKGAFLINADTLARQVFEPGYERYLFVKTELNEAFPEIKATLFYPSGELNRPGLAAHVFGSVEKTEKLNSIVHPEVRRLFAREREKAAPGDVILYDIPLLYETQMERFFDAVIVVYAPEELCLQRAMGRLHIPEEDARKRMKRQISIEKKREKADYVVENVGSIEDLKSGVDRLWEVLQSRDTPEKEGRT